MVLSSSKFWRKIHFRKVLKKRVPITNWLPKYSFSILLQDILAGLTVGMTEIPQGIAYATVAGLPPEYGLYAGIFDGFIYAIFGGCKDLNIGPSSLLSVMILPCVLAAGPQGAVLVTFLSGVLILILGVCNLGFIINFFSLPVISGFVSSGCIVIASGQFVKILGLSGKTDNFVNTWSTIFHQFYNTRTWDAVLGIGSVIFLLVLKALGKLGGVESDPDLSIPRNIFRKVLFYLSIARSALVLIIGMSLSYYLRDFKPFRTTGPVAAGFPTFQLPVFDITYNGTEFSFGKFISTFGVSVTVIPLITVLEALTIAKIFSKGKGVDGTQEMIALGLCNLVGSFIGSMPVTGSFSRTTINNVSGVKTTMAGVFTSLLLVLAIAFLTPAFYYVPRATLAAILIGAIFSIIDCKTPIIIWKSQKLDLIPYGTTFVIGLFFGPDYALLIGGIVNLLFVLYGSLKPQFQIAKNTAETDFYTITPNDTIYFPATEYFRKIVLHRDQNTGVVIINGQNIRSMDVTVAKSLVALISDLKIKNRSVVLLDFKPTVIKVCLGVDKNLKHDFFSEEAYNMLQRQF